MCYAFQSFLLLFHVIIFSSDLNKSSTDVGSKIKGSGQGNDAWLLSSSMSCLSYKTAKPFRDVFGIDVGPMLDHLWCPNGYILPPQNKYDD